MPGPEEAAFRNAAGLQILIHSGNAPDIGDDVIGPVDALVQSLPICAENAVVRSGIAVQICIIGIEHIVMRVNDSGEGVPVDPVEVGAGVIVGDIAVCP